jgi:hypothetical protein
VTSSSSAIWRRRSKSVVRSVAATPLPRYHGGGSPLSTAHRVRPSSDEAEMRSVSTLFRHALSLSAESAGRKPVGMGAEIPTGPGTALLEPSPHRSGKARLAFCAAPSAAAASFSRAVLAVLLALLLFAPASADAAAPASKNCRPVAFTPNSDDLAAGIRATRVSCRFAREFIRAAGGGPPRSYRGFNCGRRHVDPGNRQAHTRYRCSRGARTIFWKRF